MTELSTLLNHATLVASTAKKSSGGSYLLPILLLGFLAVYFLYLRPQRNRLRQQQSQTRTFEVGDEVVTTSGIVGVVLSLHGDRVVIESGHGHTMTVLRSAIARRVDPPAPEGEYSEDQSDAGPDAAPNEPWWPKGEEENPEGGGGTK
ncbi:MAG TPA: preprotein translocase subunit YajC [Acidimicrobiales bacterium]|nr:preprotein translocase subunit YajC [Acidimicrobiales bacterium]